MMRPWLIYSALGLMVGSIGVAYLTAPEPQSLAEAPAQLVASADSQRALLDQYCVSCHSEALQTGGLQLETINVNDLHENPAIWEKVLRKLRANAMPPSGMPRPNDGSLQELVLYLEGSLDAIAQANPNPGRTPAFSRLNRTEYQNAIRDMLALEIDVSSLLPTDDSSFGFDNVNVTNFSPTLMERYLAAAQKISRLAVGAPMLSPASHVELVAADLTQEDRFEGLPFGTRGGITFFYNFPLNGNYKMQVRLARDRNENLEGLTEAHELEITLDGERIGLFEVKPERSERFGTFYYSDETAGTGLEVDIPVTAGAHKVGVSFLKKNSALIESTRQPYLAHFNRDRHPRIQPAVHSLSIAGPYDTSGVSETLSRQRLFVCYPEQISAEVACAREIISTLARRAFRRPVTEDDIQSPLAYYQIARELSGFEAGIETALRAVLVSPEFIFRIEQEPEALASDTIYSISDLDLASRLSFFLWSSIPDDELLDLAAAGELSNPEVLNLQVRRMLKDSRSRTLANNFASQWLYLRNLDAVDPNTRLFPNFDDNLRQAMRQETELLFTSVMQQDKNVTELLSADYTFLNERLAKHYGMPNIYGDHFRRVELASDGARLGLLGHGSILTVTSYANRTSPVRRGKWVLENILGIPPPPPPDNVPALSESETNVKVLTMRERMVQHRANPACATCHRVMDPVGLTMENFDAVGRWRSENADNLSIDVSGHLPGSNEFAGVSGLRSALLENPEAFVGTMSEKLLTYALGRGLEYYDAPAIRTILREVEDNDYRFSTMILAIVNSTPFRMRKSL
jgi:hypothetical protein